MPSENQAPSLLVMNEFPERIGASFNLKAYADQFKDKSFIIHAKKGQVEYPSHWGLLSIKCAFRGSEYYESGNGFYAVDDSNFLIFNEGTHRSSYISSKEPVESFSVSFSPSLVKSFLYSFSNSGDRMLTDPFYEGDKMMRFTEKLYPHDHAVSPLLFKIKTLSETDWNVNSGKGEELLSFLMEALVVNQKNVWGQMRKIEGAKVSTQRELFERLNRAKDFIYSCYQDNLTTEAIANVACLNRHYFLREFKKTFNYTPHQYLQQLRIKEAKRLLETTDWQVTEICNKIGYSDMPSFCKLYKRYYTHTPTGWRDLRARQ